MDPRADGAAGVAAQHFYTVSYMDQNISRRLELNGLPPDLESAKVLRIRAKDRIAYEATYRNP